MTIKFNCFTVIQALMKLIRSIREKVLYLYPTGIARNVASKILKDVINVSNVESLEKV